MTFHRLKVVDCNGLSLRDVDGKPQERLFNFDQMQWWIGRGHAVTELQFASQSPIFVAISDSQMEKLTGASGSYAATNR